MSLLIKALEQAAKDRKGRAETAAAAPAAMGRSVVEPAIEPQSSAPFEPTLEPPPTLRKPPPSQSPAPQPPAPTPAAPSAAAQSPAPRARPAAAAAGTRPSAAAAADAPSAGPMDSGSAPRRAVGSLASLAEAQAQRERAAAVMQAGGGSVSRVFEVLRGNPVLLVGTLAVLIGIVFGTYVYLQIAKPGLFVRQVATKPQPSPASPPPPAAPATAATAPPSALPEPFPTPVAATPAPAPVPPAAGAPSGTAAGAVGPAPASPAATPVAPGLPVPAAAVVATAPPASFSPPIMEPPPAALDRGPRRDSGSFRRPEPAQPAIAPVAPAAAPAGPPEQSERIRVSPTSAQPRLNPMLGQAYALLQNGDSNAARTLYNRVLETEPLNLDALLGLAYIAAQDNRTDEATKLYLRILQLNPRHAVAQAALIGLMGRADPASAESRLKQLIARDPSPFLHFVLGNLYADQQMWPQAQQSYFQAHHLEPANPDYAYNLAVGLDHLRQGKLALGFYRRAEQLAASQPRTNFDLAHAQERIRSLASQFE